MPTGRSLHPSITDAQVKRTLERINGMKEPISSRNGQLLLSEYIRLTLWVGYVLGISAAAGE